MPDVRRIVQSSREKQLQRQSRKAARDVNVRDRMFNVKVPMINGIQVRDPLPGFDAPAAADPAAGVIYADGAMNPYTAAHESAHLLEKHYTQADRDLLTRLTGSKAWEVGQVGANGDGNASVGYRRSGSERLASYAALLATRHDPRSNRVVSDYLNEMPSRRQLLRVGRALERIGRREGLPQYVRPTR